MLQLHRGAAISFEGLHLLFRNPVLWIYGVPWFFLMRVPVSPLSVILMLFVNCCIARHAMHLLQRQSCNFYEPALWMFRHCLQFCVSIFFACLFFLVSVSTLVAMANAHVSLYFSIPFLIVVLCVMGLLSLVGPIVANECFCLKDMIWLPTTRSIRIVWQNAITYIMLVTGIFAYTAFLVFLERALVQLFAFKGSPAASTYILMLVIMQVTLAHTLFYYECYVQPQTAKQ